MKQFAVMGSPIKDSLSPEIHYLFAKQCGLKINYTKQEVSQENLWQKLQTFFDNGGTGANLTSPLKEKALEYINHLSERARDAQAINTVCIRDGVRLW